MKDSDQTYRRQRTNWAMGVGFAVGGLFQLAFSGMSHYDLRLMVLWPLAILLGYLLGRFSVGRFGTDLFQGVAIGIAFWMVTLFAMYMVQWAASGWMPGESPDGALVFFGSAFITLYLAPAHLILAAIFSKLREPESVAHASGHR